MNSSKSSASKDKLPWWFTAFVAIAWVFLIGTVIDMAIELPKGIREGNREMALCKPACAKISKRLGQPVSRIDLLAHQCDCQFHILTENKW